MDTINFNFYLNKRRQINAVLIAVFLFQYSLLIPLMVYVNPVLLVGMVSSSIMLIALIKNKRLIINAKIVIFGTILLFLILLKTISSSNPTFSVLQSYLTIACPALYLVSLEFDRVFFLKTCYKLAVLNFFVLCWLPVYSTELDYMRFGYGMIPTTVFVYCHVISNDESSFSKKRIFYTIIFSLSLIEVFVYGARGSFIPFLLFVAFNYILLRKINYKLIVPFCLSVLLYFNLTELIDALYLFLRTHGIYSYSVTKFYMHLHMGFEAASSGRSSMYAEAIDRISESPMFGSQLMGGVDDSYVHNIFLQIGEEFGVTAVLIFLLFLIWCIFIINDKNNTLENRLILGILFSLSMGRLLFSSSYWRRPEFWLFVGLGIIIHAKPKLLSSKNIT